MLSAAKLRALFNVLVQVAWWHACPTAQLAKALATNRSAVEIAMMTQRVAEHLTNAWMDCTIAMFMPLAGMSLVHSIAHATPGFIRAKHIILL
jgi:hypothetical protein